jgi:hypothetical protein
MRTLQWMRACKGPGQSFRRLRGSDPTVVSLCVRCAQINTDAPETPQFKKLNQKFIRSLAPSEGMPNAKPCDEVKFHPKFLKRNCFLCMLPPFFS